MGSHTAGPWKSETFNTKLQQNSKSAPKRSVIMRSVKGLEAILGEGMTHSFSASGTEGSTSSAVGGPVHLRATSQALLLLPGQHWWPGLRQGTGTN